MEDYKKSLQEYYEHKLRNNKKYRRCNDCNSEREFIEKDGKLIYSCGSKGKCGAQITIDLSEYIYYPLEKQNIHEYLQSYIDYNILDKYISVGDEKKGQTKLINDNREALAKLKKGFIHQNKLKKKHEDLVKMHQERIQDKKKQQMILHDLSSNPHEEDTKKELLKEYLILNNKISQSYISLTKEFDFIDNFILTKQGTITTHNTTYKEKIKKKKQPVVLSEESNLLPELQGMERNPKNKNRLNLIVAYRDPGDGSRKQQLDIFIEQMKLIFDSQTDLHIYIIEQEGERDDYDSLPELLQQQKSRMAKFNLGILKNIGYSIASTLSKSKKNSYYILSDVDLLPSKQLMNEYLKYPVKPIHLGNKGTRYNMDGNDSQFLGGVLSVNKNDFEKANGYPNNFWGWGGEDNALNRRFKDTNIKIVKPSSPVIDLETLTLKEKLDKLRSEKTKEMRKREKLEEDKKSWKENGLSNLDDLYEITSKQKEGNVTHYKVLLLVETTPLTKELSPLKFTSGNQTERYEVGDEIGYTPASPK